MTKVFQLDLRSLALTRFLFGILVFFDFTRRIKDIPAFFTDSGILSRAQVLENFEINWRMSLLNLNGSYSFALALLIIGMLASVTFTIGQRTRLSNFIMWIVMISFQARFPESASSGGDMLIRIFLFWSLFLPMGAVYSVDAAVSEEKKPKNDYVSIFSAMWIVQLFLLYFMTFLYKWAPVYHTTFDAVWYMLQLDIYTTPFGKWLGEYRSLTQVLTMLCYGLELAGPLMLIIPWKPKIFRSICVLSFWGFHLGIAATLHLGNFVPVCLIIWAAAIPGFWWDWVEEKTRHSGKKIQTLYYNERYRFSRPLAFIMRSMFFISDLRIQPTDSFKALPKLQNEKFVLLDEKNSYKTGLELASSLLLSSRFFLFQLIGKMIGSEMSLQLNDTKEAGEINFSDKTRAVAPSTPLIPVWSILDNAFFTIGVDKIKYRLHRFEKALGAFLLALVVGWNIEGYVDERDWYIGSPLDEVMFALQLNQGWAMFAPHPQRADGWWVMEGELANGKKWDALNNKTVNFNKPDSVYGSYSSEDWRKFLDNLQGSRDETYLQGLGRYLCRRWNNTHTGDETLKTFRLFHMREWTNPPDEPRSPVEKIKLWNHSCF